MCVAGKVSALRSPRVALFSASREVTEKYSMKGREILYPTRRRYVNIGGRDVPAAFMRFIPRQRKIAPARDARAPQRVKTSGRSIPLLSPPLLLLVLLLLRAREVLDMRDDGDDAPVVIQRTRRGEWRSAAEWLLMTASIRESSSAPSLSAPRKR